MGAGFNAHTLAVFTALAPCGAVCWLLLAGYFYANRDMDEIARTRFDKLVFLPVAVAWAGFIASATHLGTPANALYVVNGVGRSPLSNEVVATVAFLFFSGVYWLYTFRMGHSRVIAGILMACACASAAASVVFMSVAYQVSTVPSWDCAYSVANLVFTGVFSGASLAICVVRTMHPSACRWGWFFVVLSVAALVVGSATMLMHADWLAGVANNTATALDGALGYVAAIVVHAVLGGAGLLLQMLGIQGRAASGRRCWMGFALVLASTLLVRLPFYSSYLSLGF